ncbi:MULTISPECIES: zinc ribbon domain-containing protein [unclassified Streptomyces]|uniref:zinc ribbon domain-containing protein n=1 Tax=unclassified Streptomyces TaxID=2593676 RepID=UPI0003661090|nr:MULTISPECIES: zinc ribbon domain-containing protein [unclassified Streptomyces]
MNGNRPFAILQYEATLPTAAARAADDLAAIREQWPDLLAAIDRAPAAEWPPRESRGFLDQHPADGERARPHPDNRAPLVIREHPAPLNLNALDAAVTIERSMFELADSLAAVVQRAIYRHPAQTSSGRTVAAVDVRDRADPRRWHYAAPTSPGSRRHGLQFAALWCEGRLLGEDVGDLFTPVPEHLLDEAADTARHAVDLVDRALGRDTRTTTLDPCPYCGGDLVARTRTGGEPYATCSTGAACPAPVLLDRGRRTWRGPDLVGLWAALDGARRRPTAHGVAETRREGAVRAAPLGVTHG